MAPGTSRRPTSADRAAQRAAISGGGHVSDSHPIGRFPGATSWFALLGEVLFIGIVVTLIAVPLVTFPLALAVGARHPCTLR